MSNDKKFEAASSSGKGENHRWGELMQDLHNISKLQEDACNAQIDARQKKREASFKRRDVWLRDAEFMRHVQELGAQGRFEGFDDLVQLAAKCQIARDQLGPVEQEVIEAEQRWEGQVWELRQAEDRIYNGFQDEFRAAAAYSLDYISDPSTQNETASLPKEKELGTDSPTMLPLISLQPSDTSTTPPTHHPLISLKADPAICSNENKPRNAILLDLVESVETYSAQALADTLEWDSDSGIADINRNPAMSENEDIAHSFQRLPNKQFASLEPYPQLLTDFGSTRERVNKWLENTALVSRFEGVSLFTILKGQLERENASLPSNWAQLVVAYWDLDGASIPHLRRQRPGAETSSSENRNKENEKSKC